MKVRASLSWLALLAGLLLLGLAACGGDDDGGGGGEQRAEQQGGTLRVNLSADTDHVDPALAYYAISVQYLYPACANLLNYPDETAPEGSRLEPEVADEMPNV
jgi:ABC-type oligopeptide transport system substrate-binding subunit